MTTWTQLVYHPPTTPVPGGGWRVTTITQYDASNHIIGSHTFTATAEAYYQPVLLEYYGLYAVAVRGNMDSVAFATLDDDRFTFSVQAGGVGVLPQVSLVQDIPLPSAALLFVLALVALQLIIRPRT